MCYQIVCVVIVCVCVCVCNLAKTKTYKKLMDLTLVFFDLRLLLAREKRNIFLICLFCLLQQLEEEKHIFDVPLAPTTGEKLSLIHI